MFNFNYVGFLRPKKDLRFCLRDKTVKASFPGINFVFTKGVSRKPFPQIQILENFFKLCETPLTAHKTLLVFDTKTFATFLWAEFGLRGFVV